MKKLLPVFALFFILVSCTEDEDPGADLSGSVTGRYISTSQEIHMGVTSEYTVEWTIAKQSENEVSLEHHRSEKVIGSNPGGYKPSKPFSATIDDIEVTETGKFNVDQTVDFTLEGLKEPARLRIEGVVVGNELNASVKQTTISDNDTFIELLTFTKR